MNVTTAAAVALTLATLIVLWILLTHNQFVKLNNLMGESWAQIDVQLRRRYDLIPALVKTVQGYTNYEEKTLLNVTEARNKALDAHNGDPQMRSKPENALTETLKPMWAIAEKYPELKASANFLQLQKELSDTEDRIAASRRVYNRNVRVYNTKKQTIPSSLIAKIEKLPEATYFQINS